MNIAVTYENGEIFQHFGHTKEFKLYRTNNANIESSEIIDSSGSGHGALADFLKAHDVKVLICGGIGAGAQDALKKADIAFYGGVSGPADKAVKDYLSQKLAFDPDVKCSNHDGHHHEHGHSCGGHQ